MEALAPLVQVRRLSVAFDGRSILHDVSFEVGHGESVAIIGPNGSGKTVLLKSMLGLLPHDGDVIWRPGTTIGYVPQKLEVDRSLPLSAFNILHSKACVLGCGTAAIALATERVGLSPAVLSHQVGELSGGEMQRTLIAFAILGDPQIVILDEPTASIDEPGEERMFDLLHRLQSEMKIATITVSHDVSFVYKYASRVLCLNRSGLCYGPPRGVLTAEVLDELFGTTAFYQHSGHH